MEINIPTFSIIIPVYNREYIVIETLESVLNQTFTSWECIVVDDGSTDATIKVVEKFCSNHSRFKIIKRKSSRKKGPSSCRNIGYEHSIGEWILWLDSDDTLVNNALTIINEKTSDNIDTIIAPLNKINFDTKNVIGRNLIYSKNLICDYIINPKD